MWSRVSSGIEANFAARAVAEKLAFYFLAVAISLRAGCGGDGRILEAAMDEVKRSFPPIVDARTRLLVLGSLPGEQSLATSRYYGNPRNQFWRLVGAVIGCALEPLDYQSRLQALLAAQVGLWDTIGSATRRGSLEGAIKNHVGNDLPGLVDMLPELRAVAFNGGKAAAIGLKALAGRDLALVTLPSSSPAFTLPFEAKLTQWLALRTFLSG
jgi:hypoxanthine-DNA glycosylase